MNQWRVRGLPARNMVTVPVRSPSRAISQRGRGLLPGTGLIHPHTSFIREGSSHSNFWNLAELGGQLAATPPLSSRKRDDVYIELLLRGRAWYRRPLWRDNPAPAHGGAVSLTRTAKRTAMPGTSGTSQWRRLWPSGFLTAAVALRFLFPAVAVVSVEDVLQQHALRIEEGTVQSDGGAHDVGVAVGLVVIHGQDDPLEFVIH